MVSKKYRNYEIPSEFRGLWRYLGNAYERDEFTNTCAADVEIELAYKDVAKRLGKWMRPKTFTLVPFSPFRQSTGPHTEVFMQSLQTISHFFCRKVVKCSKHLRVVSRTRQLILFEVAVQHLKCVIILTVNKIVCLWWLYCRYFYVRCQK